MYLSSLGRRIKAGWDTSSLYLKSATSYSPYLCEAHQQVSLEVAGWCSWSWVLFPQGPRSQALCPCRGVPLQGSCGFDGLLKWQLSDASGSVNYCGPHQVGGDQTGGHCSGIKRTCPKQLQSYAPKKTSAFWSKCWQGFFSPFEAISSWNLRTF